MKVQTLCILAGLILGIASLSLADDGPYPVRVDITEQSGRVVQGMVRGHVMNIDQPTAWGGSDSAPTPPETFAFAVGACVVSTARLVAMLENISIRSISASVDGSIDFAKALGKPGNNRAGYAGLDVAITLDSDLSEDEATRFLEAVKERCPLCDNVATTTPLALTLQKD